MNDYGQRFVVRIRGDQYVIIDRATGLRVGLAAGTRKRAERERDLIEGGHYPKKEATQ